MPRGDGSGPMGQGPMTGGGFGPCGGGARYGGRGGGYGPGGGGYGRGFGRGQGFRNRRWAPAWPTDRQESPADPGLLQRLTDEVEHLKERIAELTKSS
jgi:hypothetical protein